MPSADTSDFDAMRLLARLRLRDLQLLVTLEHEGSLRAAAGRFAVTQPALSRSLGEIEAAFGLTLFTRSARGLTPTAEGRVAIRGAAMVLEEILHVRAEAAHGVAARAVLRVGAPPFIAQGWLPPRIARLAAMEPPVRVHVSEGGVPALLQELLEGRLDAVLSTIQAAGQGGWGTRLRYEPLFPASFTLIVHRRHRMARARRVGWAELAQERWVLPHPASGLHRLLEEQFVRAGVPMPAPTVEIGSPVTAARMVAEGVGLAVVPSLTLDYLRGQGAVAPVRADPEMPSTEVGLVSRTGARNERIELLRYVLLEKAGSGYLSERAKKNR